MYRYELRMWSFVFACCSCNTLQWQVFVLMMWAPACQSIRRKLFLSVFDRRLFDSVLHLTGQQQNGLQSRETVWTADWMERLCAAGSKHCFSYSLRCAEAVMKSSWTRCQRSCDRSSGGCLFYLCWTRSTHTCTQANTNSCTQKQQLTSFWWCQKKM